MRTTITLNDTLYRALRVQAAESNASVSSLVEEAVKNQLLEDAEDVEDALARAGEPTKPFDDLVAQFKREGLL